MDELSFMQQALSLAHKARSEREVPVGAVAVHEGVVVGEGYNRRERCNDPFAHAEMLALSEAARTLGRWRLTGVTLYVTLEPCAMCAGAMVQSRLTRLVFGARDPKAGAVGSLYDLVQDTRHNHRVEVAAGVLAEDCGRILKEFFRELRAPGNDK